MYQINAVSRLSEEVLDKSFILPCFRFIQKLASITDRKTSSLNSSQSKLISQPGSETSREEIVPKLFLAISSADEQDLLEHSVASEEDISEENLHLQ